MAPAIRQGYGTPAGKLVAASGCVVQFGITVIDIVGHQVRSGNLLSHARMEPLPPAHPNQSVLPQSTAQPHFSAGSEVKYLAVPRRNSLCTVETDAGVFRNPAVRWQAGDVGHQDGLQQWPKRGTLYDGFL